MMQLNIKNITLLTFACLIGLNIITTKLNQKLMLFAQSAENTHRYDVTKVIDLLCPSMN